MARYPYIALLSGSGSRTKKVASSEGFALPADLLQMLQPAVEQHGAQFVADQADHNERVWFGIASISQAVLQAGWYLQAPQPFWYTYTMADGLP